MKKAKHDPSRNPYMKKYQLNKYHERMTKAKKLLGGKCSICSSSTNLEFDHRNPGNKSWTITKLWSVPEKDFKNEVRKCRLLCRKHHLENTGKQRENGTVKSEPGKSKYDSKGRKKTSSYLSIANSLLRVAASLNATAIAKDIARNVASKHEADVKHASSFDKSKPILGQVITWNVFPEPGKTQLVISVYGRDADEDKVSLMAREVKKELVAQGVTVDYVNPLSEPGLSVFAISGVISVDR